MPEEKQNPTQRLTCIGMREWRGQKFSMAYLNEAGEEVTWAKSTPGDIVGGIYEVEHVEGNPGRIYPTSVAYVGKEDDQTKVAEWRFEDRSARATQESVRAEKRLKKENADFGDMTLRQLKERMRGQLGHQRWGTISAVMNYLNSGY